MMTQSNNTSLDITNVTVYTLWSTLTIMTTFSAIFLIMSVRTHYEKRLLPILTFLGMFMTTCITLAMAILAQLNQMTVEGLEELFILNWAITYPILLVQLCLVSRLSITDMIVVSFFQMSVSLCALFATLDETEFRWAWLAFWFIFFFAILKKLCVDGRIVVSQYLDRNLKVYDTLVFWFVILMILNPVIWSLSRGRRLLDADSEILCYLFSDVAIKVLLGVFIMANRHALVISDDISFLEIQQEEENDDENE